MRFEVLDISKDPFEQGFEKNCFDIIVGLNVVHATRDIDETLSHLKKLLHPQGVMCLIEEVKAPRWTNLIWGMTEGWWFFDDRYRKNVPLIDLDTWEKAFRNQDFATVNTLPRNTEERNITDSGLVIAQLSNAFHEIENAEREEITF